MTALSTLPTACGRQGAARDLTQAACSCEQWRRSVTLVDINRLLEDVQTLTDMPPRLQKLEDAKVP